MNIISFVSIVLGTTIFMEFVAWFTHKYIMHGVLWVLHRDHHNKTSGFFERNDLFFVIFALPSFFCYLAYTLVGNQVALAIGIGISIYGLLYFFVHEVFIHRRFKWRPRSNNAYMQAIRRGHNAHHSHTGKEDGESFGMLIVPMRFFKTPPSRQAPVKKQAK